MIFSNDRPAEVEAADDGVDAVLAGELPHVAQDVHDARVAAAGEDHEALAAHVRHQRLVVEDQRVGLPVAVAVGLEQRVALLELGRAVDLAGDQQRPSSRNDGCRSSTISKPAPSSAALLVEGSSTGALGIATRRRLQKSGWMSTGTFGAAEPLDDPVHAGRVVPVAVAEHDDVDVAGREVEPAHVLHEAVGREPGVEEDADVADLSPGTRSRARRAARRRSCRRRGTRGHAGRRLARARSASPAPGRSAGGRRRCRRAS